MSTEDTISELSKHWSITLMTVMTLAGMTAVTVGMVVHADYLTLGLVITMTGTGVQLVRSHFSEIEKANKVLEAASALAEEVKIHQIILAKKVLDDQDALAKKVLDDQDTLAKKVLEEAQALAEDLIRRTRIADVKIEHTSAAVVEKIEQSKVAVVEEIKKTNGDSHKPCP